MNRKGRKLEQGWRKEVKVRFLKEKSNDHDAEGMKEFFISLPLFPLFFLPSFLFIFVAHLFHVMTDPP